LLELEILDWTFHNPLCLAAWHRISAGFILFLISILIPVENKGGQLTELSNAVKYEFGKTEKLEREERRGN